MKSSWVVVGMIAVGLAAFWYDARNEAAAAGHATPAVKTAPATAMAQ